MNNKIFEAFDSIQADEQQKAQTRQFLQQKVYNKRRTTFKYRYAAAMLCAAILVVLTMEYVSYSTPVAAISVDSVPSVELSVNKYDRVIEVKCFNDAIDEKIRGINLKNKTYTEAVDKIIALDSMETESNDVYITVSCDDKNRKSEINRALSAKGEVTGKAVNENDVSEAHELGMSFGKYKFYVELTSYDEFDRNDDDINVDEIKDAPMRSIKDELEKRCGKKGMEKNEEEPSSKENNKQEKNGEGFGYGREMPSETMQSFDECLSNAECSDLGKSDKSTEKPSTEGNGKKQWHGGNTDETENGKAFGNEPQKSE